jgi:putative ABC transport system substrate-binding protein
LVASLARPGGNLTGVTSVTVETVSKRFELLRELVPGAAVIGYLTNPRNPNSSTIARDMEVAGRTLGRKLTVVSLTSKDDLDQAFATLVQQHVGALVISADPSVYGWRDALIEQIARHAIHTIFPSRDFVDAGGLASYGANFTEVYREVGVYTSRILRGENVAELPVSQSAKFELVVNNKTAKALGLEVPLSLLMRIDSVVD